MFSFNFLLNLIQQPLASESIKSLTSILSTQIHKKSPRSIQKLFTDPTTERLTTEPNWLTHRMYCCSWFSYNVAHTLWTQSNSPGMFESRKTGELVRCSRVESTIFPKSLSFWFCSRRQRSNYNFWVECKSIDLWYFLGKMGP